MSQTKASPTQAVGDIVGTSVPRLEGRQKVTGQAQFTDDIKRPGMLYTALLGSLYAHARILSYDVSAALAMDGVHAVITGEDYPEHRLGSFIKDQPAIARGKVRFVNEPVAAVAAENINIARQAALLIEIEYEELPSVMELTNALSDDAPVLHEDYASYFKVVDPATDKNVIAEQEFSRGDVASAWAECDVIVDGEYHVPAQQHLYLEPCSAIAEMDGSGKITIWSSTQWVFGVQTSVAHALGLPNSQVRSIAPMIGGGFGAKYEFTIEPIVARLAQLTRRPVRLTLTRDEDMSMMKSRHRGVVRVKTGAKRDGTLLAREVDLLLDGGAYSDESPAVLGFALTRASGPYRIPHIRVAGRAVYTNRLRAGAFRGFGNPQVTFGGESQMDELAEKLGMDPLALRLKNALQTGDPWLGGTTVETGSLVDCLQAVKVASDWQSRRLSKQITAAGKRRGVGAAAVWHVCGMLSASATVRLLEDGSVNVITGAVDLGQGADTILAQICAGVLGLPMDRINYVRPDTDACPFNFSTSGSRTTFMVGRAVSQASEQVREQIVAIASELLECALEDTVLFPGGRVGVKGAPDVSLGFADVSAHALWAGDGEITASYRWMYHELDVDPKRASAQGYNVGTNTFGAQIVEVEVDEITGKVEVLEVWSAHDVGKAINPRSVEGQIQGGVVQGIGYGLCEELLWDEDSLQNPSMMDYKVLGSQDVPAKIHAIILEHPDARGPFGAKGVGEPPLVGIAPAIANAVFNATGVRVRVAPLTSERVFKALQARAHS